MRWKFSRGVCLALTGIGLTGTACAEAVMTIGAATRLYTNYQLGTTSDLSCPVLKDPNNPSEVFSWTSNGQYAFAKYRGPLDDPERTLVWSGYSGRWNFTGFPSGYRPWLGNIYKHTDGTLIGFVHIETAVWDDPNCQYRQGIAISTDNGDHWRYCGDVIKSQVEAENQQNLGGCATVIVGDYFYQYFNEYETGYYRKPAVARALIADVVAAAKTFTVTPWFKYYNGTWDHNALTEAGSSVLPYPSDRYDAHGDAVYCAPLGKYLMVVYEQSGWDYLTFLASDARKGIYLYTSTDGVNWGGKQHVFTPVTGGDACYPFFAGIDGASDDSFVVGSSFKLYVPDRARHELYSIPITVQTDASLRILQIGDSNTEIGYITKGLRDALIAVHGDSGTGYYPLNGTKTGAAYGTTPTGFSVTNDASWQLLDMHHGTRRTAPHLAPDGNWIESATANATTTVKFSGTGIDAYWLARSTGGTFSITVDGAVHSTINTSDTAVSTKRTSVSGLADGNHTVLLKVVSGSVALLGVDAKSGNVAEDERSVVHRFGNGYASTRDYLDIDAAVFQSALQLLNPTHVCVVLGTNDHNLDNRSASAFQVNLETLVARIQAALPTAAVWVVSTFETDTVQGTTTLLPEYVATSFPNAASNRDVDYWNLYSWFGPYNASRMLDAYHCNATAGAAIGQEMYSTVTTGAPPVVENPELLSNTGFEANTTGWSMNGAGTLSRITTSPASGTASARVTGRTINWAGPSQNILSDLNDSGPGNYTVSAYMKLGAGSDVGRIQIGLTVGGVTTYPTVSASILSSGWTVVSGTLDLEWSGTLDNAVFYVNTETSTADVYLDDCSLRKTAVLSPAAATVFSPEPGVFTEPQTVTLSTATPGASIWYTLDGNTPASGSGMLYTNPVSITFTTTLKAVATRADMADGDVTTGTYIITPVTLSGGVVNGSFESGTNGWMVTSTNGVAPAFDVVDFQGTRDGLYALAFGDGNAAGNAIFSQSLATLAGGTHTLSFEYGAYGAASRQQRLQVEILNGTTVLASEVVTALGTGKFVASSTTFATRSLIFTADSSSTTMRFTDLTTLANSNSCDGMLDKVELLSPDPALVALQQAYVAQEFGMFLHFNMGTYTGEEWASPNQPVNTFAPTALDTDQWATAAKGAGMKYGVLTTKHHDGFALWDTSQSTYDVAATSWYAAQAPGQGDIVKRYADSFRAQGLKVGFYYSIWDRSNGIDGTTLTSRQATDYVKAELTELLSNYGPIHVIWTDGWGWKDWHDYVLYSEIYDHIKALSPTTLLVENNHTAVNTDIRTYEQTPLPPEDNLFPAELCATIRADGKWFWSAGADSTKSVEVLMAQRETSNARHASYLLDVTPNSSGVVPVSQVNVLVMLHTSDMMPPPAITTFTYDPATGVAAISIHGDAGATYQGVACANLPFDETAHVVLLSQANPAADPGTVSVDGTIVVSDAEGNATVQVSLGVESRQFLRVERVQ